MSDEALVAGKLPPKLLRETIYKHLGQPDERVLVGPKTGEDAAVLDFGDTVFITHSDPITGAVENIGSLAVKVSTNDVASRGARPRWITVVILLPEGSRLRDLERIVEQVDLEAKRLGVSVIGGHTEVTPGFTRPVLAVTAMGEAPKDRYVTSSNAHEGDEVVMTKGAAIEGTAIFASELGWFLKGLVGDEVVERGKAFFDQVSIVKEALLAMDTGAVTAMHDATEGGLAGALQELAIASDLGIYAREEQVLLNPETLAICRALEADPIRTISSGSLVIAVRPGMAASLVKLLADNSVRASIIGEFTGRDKGRWLARHDGSRLDLEEPIQDQLWAVLGRYSRDVARR